MGRIFTATTILLACFALQACTEKGTGNSVDFSSPDKVVQVIFDAAKTRDSSRLAKLCDPKGETDGDVRDICAMNPKHKKWHQFLVWFAKGRINGTPKIRNNRARVKIMFGPSGNKHEEMRLVSRNGKWYLTGY